MELSNPKSVILSGLCPQNFSLRKISYIFPKKTCSKKFLIFREMELSTHKIRNFLVFQERTYKGLRIKKIIIFLFAFYNCCERTF